MWIFSKAVRQSYCGSDVGVGLAQLLPQALRQGGHSILGGAVEMCVSTVNDTMSTHAATEKGARVEGKFNWPVISIHLQVSILHQSRIM